MRAGKTGKLFREVGEDDDGLGIVFGVVLKDAVMPEVWVQRISQVPGEASTRTEIVPIWMRRSAPTWMPERWLQTKGHQGQVGTRRRAERFSSRALSQAR